MTLKLFTSALLAGLLAGLIAVLLQFVFVEKLILEAEEYESGAKVHFSDPVAPHNDEHTDHALGFVAEPSETGGKAPAENLFARFGLAFSNVFISYVGWALVMVAGFAIAERYGHKITLEKGLLWGIAGFVSVQLVPGIGLSPELPGIPAADLAARQGWWVMTVAASAIALVLFAYGRRPVFVAIGIGLLVVPQLIGAPKLGEFTGIIPPELSAEFVSRSLAEAMAAWAVLGLAASYLWNRNVNTA